MKIQEQEETNSPMRTRWQKIESRSEQNRNKENNTKNQWDKELDHQENQQTRQAFIQTKKKGEREYSNSQNQKWKGRHNKRHGEIQSFIRSYLENLYSTKLKSIKEMDSFLDKYHLQN